MDVKKLLEAVEEKNLSIKDLKILNLVPNVVDDVVIGIPNGHVEAYLPKDMSGDRYKKWLKGRGGIFYRDLTRANSNRAHGKYVLLEGNGSRMISRLIDDDEIELFSVLKLIDGKIKDLPYMTIRTLEEDEKLTSTQRYIKENDEEYNSEIRITIPNNDISSEEPEDSEPDHGNVSLFED